MLAEQLTANIRKVAAWRPAADCITVSITSMNHHHESHDAQSHHFVEVKLYCWHRQSKYRWQWCQSGAHKCHRLLLKAHSLWEVSWGCEGFMSWRPPGKAKTHWSSRRAIEGWAAGDFQLKQTSQRRPIPLISCLNGSGFGHFEMSG